MNDRYPAILPKGAVRTAWGCDGRFLKYPVRTGLDAERQRRAFPRRAWERGIITLVCTIIGK